MTKKNILLENGTFNKNSNKVTDRRFLENEFYDPQDLVQVKYEMLKTARESERSISEVAESFGFSRAAFYKIKTSFEKEGVTALIPDKSGPKAARKLTTEYQRFIDSYLISNPDASSGCITALLKNERGLEISKRTVERYRRCNGRND